MAKKKILIVDDSATVVLMEKTILANGNFDVSVANDGVQALDSIATNRPDLVLMDVVMPNMDGYETVKRLRADPATRDMPIIMVTTKGETEHRDKGLKIGCNDYITKPINASELLAKIRALVSA
ncbi:MAG: response regulator [Vicinamibacteria bacterium]|nr:response regulator [Vicinamibacteria bacterium]